MPCTGPVPVAELQHEHGVLLRYLGEVQRGVSVRLARLEADNLRLRAALMVNRTAWLWGLGPPVTLAGHTGATPVTPPASPLRVLCRVGCEGHAHAWLDEGGQCRRTGSACEALAVPATGRPEPR
jgi:hypothetical protein